MGMKEMLSRMKYRKFLRGEGDEKKVLKKEMQLCIIYKMEMIFNKAIYRKIIFLCYLFNLRLTK